MTQMELFPPDKETDFEVKAGKFFGAIMATVFGLGLTCVVTGISVALSYLSMVVAMAPMYAFVYCWNTWLAGWAGMTPFVSSKSGLTAMVLLTFLYMTFNALFLPRRS
jgi:hypothetical protein